MDGVRGMKEVMRSIQLGMKEVERRECLKRFSSTVQREYTQSMMYGCDISYRQSGIEIERHFAVSNCSA